MSYKVTQEYLDRLYPAMAIPPGGKGIEVGVLFGNHAETLLNGPAQASDLVLVDCWEGEGDYAGVCAKFSGDKRVHIIRARSLDAVAQFGDGQFDWAYIDANHSYGCVLADAGAYWPKVRDGGWMLFHDGAQAQVTQAVTDHMRGHADCWIVGRGVDQHHTIITRKFNFPIEVVG